MSEQDKEDEFIMFYIQKVKRSASLWYHDIVRHFSDHYLTPQLKNRRGDEIL